MDNEVEIKPTDEQLIDFDKFLKAKTKFILDENKNVIPATLYEWGEWLENPKNIHLRIIKQDVVNDMQISTVFIGLDHGYPEFHEGKDLYKPLIFETMVFKGRSEIRCCDRYSTWDEAKEGHLKAVEWVKNGCKDKENVS